MAVRLEELSPHQREIWDSYVDQSPQTSFFHQFDALTLLARYFDANLHLLVGYVGDEPTGILPIFEHYRGPVRLASSPPPAIEINVGPALLNFEKLKQRKAERRNRAFLDRCLDWIEAEIYPDYVKIGTTDRYADVRHFLRRDLTVRPSYTYVLDITDEPEDLLGTFSRDARTNIRNTDDTAYQIQEEGHEGVDDILDLLRRRFAEQGRDHYLDGDLVTRLRTKLGPEQVRVYTCRVDGSIVSGIIAVEYGDTVYRWQGGPKPDVDVPANDLLDWYVVRDARTRDRERYDFVGAMLPRLCEYKAKFGPEPVAGHAVVRENFKASVAGELYRRLPDGVQSRLPF